MCSEEPCKERGELRDTGAAWWYLLHDTASPRFTVVSLTTRPSLFVLVALDARYDWGRTDLFFKLLS